MRTWNFIFLLFLNITLTAYAANGVATAANLSTLHYLGIILILLSIVLLIAEIVLPTFGAIGTVGITIFVIGALLLLNGGLISVPFFIVVTLFYLILLLGIIILAIRASKKNIVSGREALLSATGTVKEDFIGLGWVQVEGETWQAQSNTHLNKGDKVQIVGLNGLVLTVKKV